MIGVLLASLQCQPKEGSPWKKTLMCADPWTTNALPPQTHTSKDWIPTNLTVMWSHSNRVNHVSEARDLGEAVLPTCPKGDVETGSNGKYNDPQHKLRRP